MNTSLVILCLTFLMAISLWKGYDHTLLIFVIIVLAGLGGYHLKASQITSLFKR